MLQPHIQCSEEQTAAYCILPGDPARVDRIAAYLEDVEPIAFNREHKSVRGSYKGLPILVVSTGMGGPSTGIAVEELARLGVKCMIRVGSCGALQSDIAVGDLIILNGCVRDEGTSKAYIEEGYPAIPDTDVLLALREAAKAANFSYHIGIGRSHDSFYTDKEEVIDQYWSGRGVLGADMESAALFTIGKLRAVRTGSVLATVATYQGDQEQDINAYVTGASHAQTGEERAIRTALEACVRINQETM